MMTQRSSRSVLFLLAIAVVLALSFAIPAHAQNVAIDLTTACNGGSCFNWAGIYNDGTSFINTLGMDNGQSNGCAVQPPCPAAYPASGNKSLNLVIGTGTPPPPPSLTVNGVPFDFGPVNATPCGPTTSVTCTNDVIQLAASPVTLTVPSAIYSTLILLGTAVNGSHGGGSVSINYTDGTSDVFSQTFSDWCGFSGNPNESIAVTPINRINMDGTLVGPNCNLYEYTYPANVTKEVTSVSISSSDTTCSAVPNCSYILAASLKPPTYTIDGGTASPTSVSAGGTSTATVTVVPEPGYGVESPATINLSCSISPQIVGYPPSAATPPTCSLSPTSVTVTGAETSSPTTTVTFTAASASSSGMMRPSKIFYALWLPIPALVLVGFGFDRTSRRKKFFGWFMLGLLAIGILTVPGCVSTVHLGNVGTPPGQYTISITGVDQNGLSQASNPAGTSNTVVVTVGN
jgi:hypothetical protein